MLSRGNISVESPSPTIVRSQGSFYDLSAYKEFTSQTFSNKPQKQNFNQEETEKERTLEQEILCMSVHLSEDSFTEMTPQKENVSSEQISIDVTDANIDKQNQNYQEILMKNSFNHEQLDLMRQKEINSRLTIRGPNITEQSKHFFGNESILACLFSYLDVEQMMRIYQIFNQKSLKSNLTLAQKVIYRSFLKEDKIKSFWLRYFSLITKKHQQKALYQKLAKLKSENETDISNDLERTCIGDEEFKSRTKLQQLQRVLRAVSNEIRLLGYIQGFNFIGARLLQFFRDEELTFHMFTSLLKQSTVFNLYQDNMKGLKLLNFQLNCFIQNLFPDVDLYFTSQGLNVDIFVAQWILTFFSLDFNSDFFVQVMNLYILFGESILVKVCLSIIEQVKDTFIQMEVEQAMQFLKEGFRDENLDINIIIERAIEYQDVNEFVMKKLEQTYKKTKTKRVLLIKDQDQNQTLIKELPQLPDEYYTTEENAEEDYESDFQSLTKGKRQIKSSLNNVTALEIKAFPDFEYDEFNSNTDHIQAPKTSRDSNQKNKFTFFNDKDSSNIPSPIHNLSNSSLKKDHLTVMQFSRTQHIFQENKANKPQNTCEIRRKQTINYEPKLGENFDPNQALENAPPDLNLRKRFNSFKNQTMKFQEQYYSQQSYLQNPKSNDLNQLSLPTQQSTLSKSSVLPQPQEIKKLQSQKQRGSNSNVIQISAYKQAMSPKNGNFNKQSQKINLHCGDLLSDDWDHTTLITPKESLVLSRTSNSSVVP